MKKFTESIILIDVDNLKMKCFAIMDQGQMNVLFTTKLRAIKTYKSIIL